MLKRRLITLITMLVMTLVSATAFAAHFASPGKSTTIMHVAGNLIIDGAAPQIGDEVALFGASGDPAGPIGVFVVSKAGNFYGDLVINGDAPSTSTIKEGASEGEGLSVKVWSASKAKEYSGGTIALASTSDYTQFNYLPTTFPLVFAAGSFTELNVTATSTPQTINSVTFSPGNVTVGGSTTVTGVASSGLPVTFTSTTPLVCTVTNGNTVNAIAGGTCTIAADQAGDSTFGAAPTVTANIIPAAANQTITAVNFTPNTVTVGGTTTVSATITSGLPVTFTSTTPLVCTVTNSNTVNALTGGTCTIAASQAGNISFNPATPVNASIVPAKLTNTITNVAIVPATLNVGITATVSASATSTLPVIFGSTTLSVCTVSGNAITVLAPGTCTITADQGGDSRYNLATTVNTNFSAVKQSQTIGAVTFNPTSFSVDGTTTVSATASSTLPVVFSTSPSSTGCTVVGNQVTAQNGATCVIQADQAGNGTFLAAAQVTGSIVPTKLTNTITGVTIAPTSLTVGIPATVSATATSSLPVVFGSTTQSVCIVNGNAITVLAAGTCTITASEAGNLRYGLATTVSTNYTAGLQAQTINPIVFTPPTVSVKGTTVASTSATSGLAVTFTSLTTGICTVSNGNTVTALNSGTCTIAADQSGNGTFAAATRVTKDITPAAIAPDAPSAVTAVPGNTQASVSFTAPAFNGGSAITSYTVTSAPGGFTATGAASPLTVTGLTNGTGYTFSVTATNAAGTSAPATSSSVVPNILTVSIGSPSATIAKSGATVTYTITYANADAVTLAAGDVTVNTTGTATGAASVSGSGIASRTVTISGITGNGTLGITIAANTATASGGAIHAPASAASATFIADNTAPALSVTALNNGTVTSNNTFNVTGTATDDNGVSLTVNGTDVTLGNGGAFNTSVTLVNGVNTVLVIATDNAGNQSTDSRTITYDHTAPVITFTTPTPADGTFTNLPSATVSGTVTKPGLVVVTVNSNTPITIATSGAQNGFTTPITLTAGANVISVTASDTAVPANSSTVQRTVTFDNSLPVLSVTDPSDNITTTFSSYLVKGNVVDNFSGITLSFAVDGTAITPSPVIADDGSFQQTVSFTDGKTYHISVTATDRAGNNSSTVQRNIVYRTITIADALRALKIATGVVTFDSAQGDDLLDVGPLVNGLPHADGIVDISDAVVLLRKTVGLVNW
jgi:hypothetical protein